MQFTDNSGKNVIDKLHKLRPVIDKINERLRLVPFEEFLADFLTMLVTMPEETKKLLQRLPCLIALHKITKKN